MCVPDQELFTSRRQELSNFRLLQAVFLSGGFSLSPYLLKVVKSLCDRRRILLLRSEQRWGG